MRLPIAGLTLAFSLFAAPAVACDIEAKPGSQCVAMPIHGVPGVWLAESLAEGLRVDHLTVPVLEQRLRLSDELIRELGEQASRQRAAAQEGLRANAVLRQSLADVAAQAERSWYESPVLWFVAGVAVASAAAAGTVIALK